MKIPVWIVAIWVLIAIIAVARVVHKAPEFQPIDTTEIHALRMRAQSLEAFIQHQDSIINNRQHEIETIVKRVPIYVNRVNQLNADSSIKLFDYWTGQLQDSSYARRYFCLDCPE